MFFWLPCMSVHLVSMCGHVLYGPLPPPLLFVCAALHLPAGTTPVHFSFSSLTPHMPATKDSKYSHVLIKLQSSCSLVPMFQRNMLPPSFTLKKVAVDYYETLVPINQTEQQHITTMKKANLSYCWISWYCMDDLRTLAMRMLKLLTTETLPVAKIIPDFQARLQKISLEFNKSGCSCILCRNKSFICCLPA